MKPNSKVARSRPASLAPLPPPLQSHLEPDPSDSPDTLRRLGSLGSVVYWGTFSEGNNPIRSGLDGLATRARFRVAYRGPLLAAKSGEWSGVLPTAQPETPSEMLSRSADTTSRIPHPDETFLGLVQLEPLRVAPGIGDVCAVPPSHQHPGGFMGNTNGTWPPPREGAEDGSAHHVLYFEAPSRCHALFVPEVDCSAVLSGLRAYHTHRLEEDAVERGGPPTAVIPVAQTARGKSRGAGASAQQGRRGASSATPVASRRLAPLSVPAQTLRSPPPSVPNHWPLAPPPASSGVILSEKPIATNYVNECAAVPQKQAFTTSEQQSVDDLGCEEHAGSRPPSGGSRRTRFRFEGAPSFLPSTDHTLPAPPKDTVAIIRHSSAQVVDVAYVDVGTNTDPVLIQELLDATTEGEFGGDGSQLVTKSEGRIATSDVDVHSMSQCRVAIEFHLAALKSHLSYLLPGGKDVASPLSVAARYHSMQLTQLTAEAERAASLRATLLGVPSAAAASPSVVEGPAEAFESAMGLLSAEDGGGAAVVGGVGMPKEALRWEVLEAMRSQLDVFLQDLTASISGGSEARPSALHLADEPHNDHPHIGDRSGRVGGELASSEQADCYPTAGGSPVLLGRRLLPPTPSTRVNRLYGYVTAVEDVVREGLEEIQDTLHTPYITLKRDSPSANCDVDKGVQEWLSCIEDLRRLHQIPPLGDAPIAVSTRGQEEDNAISGHLLDTLLVGPLLNFVVLPLVSGYVDPLSKRDRQTVLSDVNGTDGTVVCAAATADHLYGLDLQPCAFWGSFLWDHGVTTIDNGESAVRTSVASNTHYLDVGARFAPEVAAAQQALGGRVQALAAAVSNAKQEGDVDGALDALCCGMEESLAALTTARNALDALNPSMVQSFVDKPRFALRALFEQLLSPSAAQGGHRTFVEHILHRPVEAALRLCKERLSSLLQEYADAEADFIKERFTNAEHMRDSLNQYGILQEEGNRVAMEISGLLTKLGEIHVGREALAKRVSQLSAEREDFTRRFQVSVVVNAACRRGVDDIRTTVEGVRDVCWPRVVAWLRSLCDKEEGSLSDINVSLHDRLTELRELYGAGVTHYAKFAKDFLYAKSKVLERLAARVDALSKRQFWCEYHEAGGQRDPPGDTERIGSMPLSPVEETELAFLKESMIAVEQTIKTVDEDLSSVVGAHDTYSRL